MGKQTACRDCGGMIAFEKRHGKWVPLDPSTGERHICKLNQLCGTCSKEFQGAPWMKKCPDCFQADRNTTANFNRNRTGIEGAVEASREDLDDDFKNNDPF